MAGSIAGLSRVLPRQEPVRIDETMVETVTGVPVSKPEPAFKVAAKGAVLMDASTGEVLFEQDSHVQLPPASVTKVMTMLLVMEAVEE